MTAVLHNFCLLGILSGALARPQYITELRHRAPAPSNHDEPQLTQTVHDYPPDDVEEVAARKRNYQAAFAALASQMAVQSRIFADETSNLPSGQPLALQSNFKLHHRNIKSTVQLRETRLKPVHTNRRAALFSPVKHISPPLYPRLPKSKNRGSYIYNKVEDIRSLEEPVRSHQESLVLLPNGFLADTPEVEAAKREHLAAVERARAATARAESREPYVIPYRPAQRRASQHFPADLQGSTPQIYYQL